MIWEMQHADAFRHMRVHELGLVEGGKTFEGRQGLTTFHPSGDNITL